MTDFAVRKFFEIEKDFEHSQKLSVADFNFISKELRDAWRFNYRAGYIDALQDHGSWYLGVQRIGEEETPIKQIIREKFDE